MGGRHTLRVRDRKEICRKITQILFRRQEIIFAYVFGSFIADASFHDIDIGVFIKKDWLGRQSFLDYQISLEIELEKELPFLTDVKVLNYAPIPLCHSASDGRVLFCRDEEVRYDWVEKIWDTYLDMQYFLRNSLRDLLVVELKK
ncbi:MAG: nucleotidyltransferase domain-containing protein [Bacillota bacterium]